jgi:hypothetical protein
MSSPDASGVWLAYEIRPKDFAALSKPVQACDHAENKDTFAFCPTCGQSNAAKRQSLFIKGDDGELVQYNVPPSYKSFPDLQGRSLTFAGRSVVQTFFGDRLFICLDSCRIPDAPLHGSFTQGSRSGYEELDLSDQAVLCELLKEDLADHGLAYEGARVKIIVFPPGVDPVGA